MSHLSVKNLPKHACEARMVALTFFQSITPVGWPTNPPADLQRYAGLFFFSTNRLHGLMLRCILQLTTPAKPLRKYAQIGGFLFALKP